MLKSSEMIDRLNDRIAALKAALFERPSFEDWCMEEGLTIDTTAALVCAYGFYLEAMGRLGRDTTTRWED